MDILYLILAVITGGLISICSSLFVSKNPNSTRSGLCFNTLLSATPLIGWGIYYAIEQGFNPYVLLYSLGYGVSFIGTFIFLHLSLKTGPLSFTSLFSQLSLIFTAIWGIIFWGTPWSSFTIVGLCLIVISLIMCLAKKEEGKRFNWKWLIFAICCSVCNGAATIFVKAETIEFDNHFGGEMMFFAFILIFIVSIIFFLCLRKEVHVTNLKKTWWIASLAGLANMLVNVFVILLAKGTMSPAIIYPVIAVGSLAIAVFFSIFFNKEKISLIQIIGLIIGAIAIVFLSI